MAVRKSAMAGGFYPARCNEIEKMFKYFNSLLDDALKDKRVLSLMPKALIVPHAGYVYSGFTANVAYRIAKNVSAKRVVVIGPSHRVYIEGISGSFYDSFQTPCGEIEIDKKYLEFLASEFEINFFPQAHQEHSTEVQMPFIKYYLPDAKVIELVYGKVNPVLLGKICKEILKDKDNLIVISTDLSHYYSLDYAKKIDGVCLKGIKELSIDILQQGCEACGKKGVEGIIYCAKELLLKPLILDYRTSADFSGDKNRVVGYVSAILTSNH
jgi:AmmeMemoRadiSam system protein B